MSTEEVVVKFYDAICEYGRPGRLGKTFQTKKNYYFLDAGTGKVAQIRACYSRIDLYFGMYMSKRFIT